VAWSPVPGGRGGDDEAGFEISIALEHKILRIVAWGLWSVDLAQTYRAAMFAGFRTLRGQSWAVLSDRRRTTIQNDEVRAIMSEVLDRATVMGRERAAVLVTGAVAKLQMRRLATDTRIVQHHFQDEDEALAWLLSAKT
jgi:hypothetical protein